MYTLCIHLLLPARTYACTHTHTRVHTYSRVAEKRNTFGSEGARVFLKIFSVPLLFAKKPLRRSFGVSMSPADFFVGAHRRRNGSPKGLRSLDPRGGPRRESVLHRSLPNIHRVRRLRKPWRSLPCGKGGGSRNLQRARGPRSLGVWGPGCPRSDSKRKPKERG